MIDTIVIRVHDLPKHKELVRLIKQNFKGYSKETALIPKEPYDDLTNETSYPEIYRIDILKMHKSGKSFLRYHTGKKLNNSKHYYLSAYINNDRDFIEFNFSIPKYVYGTNILMFIEHIWLKNFSFSKNSQLKYNINVSYNILINFLKSFFFREFVQDKIIDPYLVEINRVDFCYNQVFQSKKDALQYLEFQKKLKKKHSRASSNNYREYETSLMYITDRYSAKIYHKGAEYEKHDKKENIQINKEKGEQYFNVEELQRIADKILRYEITFRNKQFSYLFKHNIFRHTCPIHKRRYEIYKNVEKKQLKNQKIYEISNTYKREKNKEKYLFKHPLHKISRDEKAIHKTFSKLLNKQSSFYLKILPEVEVFNTNTIAVSHYEPRAHFSKKLFLICGKFFLNFIKEFQVTEMPTFSLVKERIDIHNKFNSCKLPKLDMLRFYGYLLNNSFDEIRKLQIYSRATFYRYKARFKKIGITQQCLMPVKTINVQCDLSEYHSMILYSKLKQSIKIL